MADATDGYSVNKTYRPLPGFVQDAWRSAAYDRLDDALESAVSLPVDDDSRIVFISDVHRSDGSEFDRFLVNKPIYHEALTHYFEKGFTYIEVGDGDDLWNNGRYEDILRAHHDTYDLLHQFQDARRLHLLVGNHDTYDASRYQADRDGMPTYHSLLLNHQPTGQSLLVLHGHQADLFGSRYYPLSRLFAGLVLRRMQRPDRDSSVPVDTDPWRSRSVFDSQGKRIERRILEWIGLRQMPIVCGHTHLPYFPAAGTTPYFNIGSCVMPGFLTALELQRSELTLVKWFLDSDGQIARQRLTPFLKIAVLAEGFSGSAE